MYDQPIFGAEAPHYYAKGMPAIPLHHWQALDKEGKSKAKAPFFFDWSKWGKDLDKGGVEITPENQQQWIESYSSNNIGMILGRRANLDMLDIDTTDEAAIKLILSLVPSSPWVRIGAKGMMLAFRHNPNIRKKIQIDMKAPIEQGKPVRVVEYLTNGQQIVLPPSIHPDTRRPYVANCHLYDVYDQLPVAPDNLEYLLRTSLANIMELSTPNKKQYSIGKKISFGSRDSSMTELAGSLTLDIIKGRTTVLGAFNFMKNWVETSVEQVEGDRVDYNKGINQIVHFLINDLAKGRVLPQGWDEGLTEQDKQDYGLDFSEDNQAWSFEKIMEHLKKEYESVDSNQQRRTLATEAMLKKITVSPNIGTLERDRIMLLMSKSSGDKLPVGKYHNRLKELEKGEIAGANHTEIAEECLKEYKTKKGELKVEGDSFWQWKGSHWEKVKADPDIFSFIATYFGHLEAAKKKSDHNGIHRIMISLSPHGLSTGDIRGVNFANGFVTKDMKLVPHNPDYGMTYTMPFSYLPELKDKCPRFMKLLEDCWGHNDDFEDRKKLLQEAIAVTMFGMGTSFQKAILLHGAPGSGKSQILEIVSALVPEEAKSVMPPKIWAERFALVNIIGKIMNVCGELPDDGYINGEMFKQMVDGSEITDRALYGSFTNFRCQATLWFAANKYPKSRDTTGGFDRRWAILHFDKVIPEEEKILDLGKSIAAEEAEAITAWALEALPRVITKGGYTLPASHHHYHKEMKSGNSNIRPFVEQKIVVEEGSTTRLQDVYHAYWQFVTIGLGLKSVSLPRLTEEMLQILEEGHKQGMPRVKLDKNDKNEPTVTNLRVVK